MKRLMKKLRTDEPNQSRPSEHSVQTIKQKIVNPCENVDRTCHPAGLARTIIKYLYNLYIVSQRPDGWPSRLSKIIRLSNTVQLVLNSKLCSATFLKKTYLVITSQSVRIRKQIIHYDMTWRSHQGIKTR